MSVDWSRATSGVWIANWLTFSAAILWQMSWHWGFKANYSWIHRLITCYLLLLFTAKFMEFLGGDGFEETGYGLIYNLSFSSTQLAWSILMGPLLFWARRSERVVAIWQYILISIVCLVMLLVIVLWSVGFKSTAGLISGALVAIC